MKTLEHLYNSLKSLGLPVAYRCFKDKTTVPYIVYFVSGESIYGADSLNMICERTVRIELYTEIKDYQLEESLESLFPQFELGKSENFISEENLIETVYEFSYTYKI